MGINWGLVRFDETERDPVADIRARMRARHAITIREFDPDQPRDDMGRWTSDGGGGESDPEGIYSDVGAKGGEDAGKGKQKQGSDGGSKGQNQAGSGGAGRPIAGGHPRGSSRAYQGRSPRRSEAVGRLIGDAEVARVFEPTPQQSEILKARGATPLTFYELGKGGGKVFHFAIDAAKAKNPYGAAVTLYPVEHYDNLRTFLTADGKAGFALDGDDIVSVFKNPDSAAKYAASSLLTLAIEEGGRRLDCFDTELPAIYSREGFKAVARTGFDDQYAPPGWSTDLFKKFNDGRPDVVFMNYAPGASAYRPGDGNPYPSYDEASDAQKADIAKDKRSLLFRYDPDQPRDEDGKWTGDGGGSSGGGGLPKTASAPAESEKPKKGKVALSDFEKDKVDLGRFKDEKYVAEKFIEEWESHVGEAPADFKREFLGGVNASMTINRESANVWSIDGSLFNKDGRSIGTYTRNIDWRSKTAKSAYFKLNPLSTGLDVGKKVLAGNVATYQKLGIDKVNVYANIDVGGYAWAKYGYIPTRSAWAALSAKLSRKLSSRGGTTARAGTYQPQDWDMIGEDDREAIKEHWLEDTRQDFISTEIESWRDSGQALDEAKYVVAKDFDGKEDWAVDAITDYLKDHEEVPYSATQILSAVSADYETGYDGRKDIAFDFDDSKLKEPTDAPPPEQLDLPGIEAPDLSAHLTQDMRDQITEALVEASNDKAQSDSENLEPPEYLVESAEESQSYVWDDKSDREKYRFADENGYLPSYPNDEDEDEPVEVEDEDEKDDLASLAKSSDPKAIWAIADSDQGKRLLLGTDWDGVLNLKDPESMARFNAYVGKGKSGATA